MSQVRISRQHWESLLGELDVARRQRHLLTYRALIERLQLPSPAMQTLTAALEYLAVLDARADQPLRSSLVISQGASRLPRTGFSSVSSAWGVSPGQSMVWKRRLGMPPKWYGCSSTAIRNTPDAAARSGCGLFGDQPQQVQYASYALITAVVGDDEVLIEALANPAGDQAAGLA